MASRHLLIPTPLFAPQPWCTITIFITVSLAFSHARFTIWTQVDKLFVALPSAVTVASNFWHFWSHLPLQKQMVSCHILLATLPFTICCSHGTQDPKKLDHGWALSWCQFQILATEPKQIVQIKQCEDAHAQSIQKTATISRIKGLVSIGSVHWCIRSPQKQYFSWTNLTFWSILTDATQMWLNVTQCDSWVLHAFHAVRGCSPEHSDCFFLHRLHCLAETRIFVIWVYRVFKSSHMRSAQPLWHSIWLAGYEGFIWLLVLWSWYNYGTLMYFWDYTSVSRRVAQAALAANNFSFDCCSNWGEQGSKPKVLIESLHERRLPNLLHLSAKATPPNENERQFNCPLKK